MTSSTETKLITKAGEKKYNNLKCGWKHRTCMFPPYNQLLKIRTVKGDQRNLFKCKENTYFNQLI